jgi:phosphoadenosine phosphosulfate reductase
MNVRLDKLKRELEQLQPIGGLTRISQEFSGSSKFSSALGMEDQIITHWIGKEKLPIQIFTLDTGRLFQETYDLLDLTMKKYNVSIQVLFPDHHQVETMVLQKGINSFYDSVENRKECCHIRKVEPLSRALQNTKVWITGLRADQSVNRKKMEMVEWDEQYQVIKYNPLINWNLAEVERYIQSNHIPVNALHKNGFTSIGCAPCTRAILQGEDVRAGRWWWETSAKECGLHEVSGAGEKNG